MSRYPISTKSTMQTAPMALILLLLLTACGNAPATQDCAGQACFQALPDGRAAETDDVDGDGTGFDGVQAELLPDGLDFDSATVAPEPVPAAGTPAPPGPTDLDRFLLPTFGESLFDLFVAGMLLGPDGLNGGGSLLFDDEPSTTTNSQRPYLEELCRRLGQSDFACRQRYGG